MAVTETPAYTPHDRKQQGKWGKGMGDNGKEGGLKKHRGADTLS